MRNSACKFREDGEYTFPHLTRRTIKKRTSLQESCFIVALVWTICLAFICGTLIPGIMGGALAIFQIAIAVMQVMSYM